MKHFIYIMIIAVLATGCGIEEDEPKVFDPALAPIVYEYIAYTPDKGHLDKLVSLKFGAVGSDSRHGLCEKDNIGSPFEKRYITIAPTNERGWVLKAIVMHELAHCLHDKEHTDDPDSLMNPNHHGGEDYWRENLEAKVRELF